MKPEFGDLIMIFAYDGYPYGPFIFIRGLEDPYIQVVKNGSAMRFELFPIDDLVIISSLENSL